MTTKLKSSKPNEDKFYRSKCYKRRTTRSIGSFPEHETYAMLVYFVVRPYRLITLLGGRLTQRYRLLIFSAVP